MTTTTKHSDYTNDFIEVYLAELDYVKQRREKMGIPAAEIVAEMERIRQELEKPCAEGDPPSAKIVMPSANAGLVGLAFSGGGIRSATFNLGLFQALAEKNVLQYCDYLSTVSGGGYIGSCLSSLLADTQEASTKREEFPLRDQWEVKGERKEVNHLRAAKNYLGLTGNLFNLGNWHFFGLNFSSKVLLNIIPIALMILLAWLLYTMERTFYMDFLDILGVINNDVLLAGKAIIPSVGLSTLLLITALMATVMVVITRWKQVGKCFRNSYELRQHTNSWLARWTLVAVSLIAAYFLFSLIYTQGWKWVVGNMNKSFDLIDIFFYLLIGAIVVVVVGRFHPTKTLAQQKFPQLLVSAALLILFISLPTGFLALIYQLEFEVKQYKYTELTCQHLQTSPEKWVDCVGSVKDLFTKPYIETEGWTFKMPELIERDLKTNHDEETRDRLRKLGEVLQNHEVYPLFLKTVPIMALILLVIGMLVDINRNSLHHFYRDRLSGTFLIRRVEGEIQLNPALLLKDLHQHYNGPYHLINVTLNVPVSKNPLLRGRGADLFTFSKYYCGAESTGYRSTADYQNGHTELATAMAISGAAASPQMGGHTNPLFAMAMTLLNYRLHQWLPNPQLDNPPRFVFWPSYLMRELLRQGTETDKLVNLSDGGHHENLGVYPLLKRRCRLIIASDASADPEFEMTELANVQRKARIDLNTEIVWSGLSGENLGLDSQRHTHRRFLVGKIRYPKGQAGILLYLKATITGTERCHDVLAYRQKNASFPHQSTADQFFDEDQFESYRRLGQLSGDEVFPKEIGDIKELEELLHQYLKETRVTDHCS